MYLLSIISYVFAYLYIYFYDVLKVSELERQRVTQLLSQEREIAEETHTHLEDLERIKQMLSIKFERSEKHIDDLKAQCETERVHFEQK